jgi:hypothetical protein
MYSKSSCAFLASLLLYCSFFPCDIELICNGTTSSYLVLIIDESYLQVLEAWEHRTMLSPLRARQPQSPCACAWDIWVQKAK